MVGLIYIQTSRRWLYNFNAEIDFVFILGENLRIYL